MWAVEAVLLCEPHSQRLLLYLFAGSALTPSLQRRLTHLLRLLAVLQAFDVVQYAMQGVVQVLLTLLSHGPFASTPSEIKSK